MKKPMSQMKQVNRGAFLIRFWRDDPESPWQFLVEDAATRQRYLFSDFPKLVVFLEVRLGRQQSRLYLRKLWPQIYRAMQSVLRRRLPRAWRRNYWTRVEWPAA